jgi:hypothetical protein
MEAGIQRAAVGSLFEIPILTVVPFFGRWENRDTRILEDLGMLNSRLSSK